MSVQEIESAIARLKPAEKRKIAAWVMENCPESGFPARLKHLRSGRGLWKNRKNLPDVHELRRQFDRV